MPSANSASRRDGPSLFRLPFAGGAAGLVLASTDLVRFAASLPPSTPISATATAFLATALRLGTFGAGLGLVLSLLGLLGGWRRRPAGPRPILRRLVIWGGFLALILPAASFSQALFSGRWIAAQAAVPVLRIATPPTLAAAAGLILLVLSSWLASLRGGGVSRTRVAALSLGALALLLDQIDAAAYRGQYPLIHDLIWLAAGTAGTAALAPVVLSARLGRRSFAVASASALVLVAGSTLAPPEGLGRFIYVEKSTQGARLTRLTGRRELPAMPADGERQRIVEDLTRIRGNRHTAPDAGRRALTARAAAEGWNLLWVTIDTLRADGVSAYGYPRKTTPTIDALAEGGVLFERCWSQFPITHFSFESAFHSRYPSATPLYAELKGLPRRQKSQPTLAQLFSSAGFRTASFPAIPEYALAHPTVRALTEGFLEVSPGREGRVDLDADFQVDLARRWLFDPAAGRRFAWLHLMDPHHPYIIHDDHAFGARARDRYDSEVAYADHALGELLAELEARGQKDRYVVVVNADHGEGFGEHDTTFHGARLYEEQIRVPLVIRIPGLMPRRIRTPVENLDIAVTLGELFDLPPLPDAQGDSLLPLVLEGDAAAREDDFAFAELPDAALDLSPGGTNRQAVVVGNEKLILNRSDGIAELYDLDADPGELVNRAFERPESVARLSRIIRAIELESAILVSPAGLADVDDRTLVEALARHLESSSPHQRADFLRATLHSKPDGLSLLCEGILANPHVMPCNKNLVLRRSGHHIDPQRKRQIAFEFLAEPRTYGSIATALEVLDAEGCEGFVGDERRLLTALLAAPTPIDVGAAELLARDRAPEALPVLDRAVHGRDPQLALRAAAGLARYGVTEVLPNLRSGVRFTPIRPELETLAIEALARLRDRESLPLIEDIVREPFTPAAIAHATLDYFRALPIDDALAGFVRSLRSWDTSVVAAARAAVEERLPADRVPSILAAAQRARSSMELAEQERFDLARDLTSEAVDLLGAGGAAAGLLLDLTARCRLAADEEGVRRAAERLAAQPAPRAWVAAATAIRDEGTAEIFLEVRSIELLAMRPLEPAVPTAFAVTLENAADQALLGGSLFLSPRFHLVWERDGQVYDSPTAGATLEPGALAPGARTVLAVSTLPPPTGGDWTVRLEARRAGGAPVKVGGEKELRVSLPGGRSAEGLDPRDLVHVGWDIVRNWAPRRECAGDLVVLDDASVVMTAKEIDSWIVGPQLQDLGETVVLEVDLSVQRPVPGGRANIQVFVFRGDESTVDPAEVKNLPIEIDGQFHRIEVAFPAVGGRGVRRFRIDPGETDDRVCLQRIRIHVP